MNQTSLHPSTSNSSMPIALVVDDELSNRIILRSLLNKHGYQVIEADNGATAVELFYDQLPDIIFMDIMMPVMDGYTAVEKIREVQTSSFIPIIFLTAMTDEEALARCIEVGGDDFMTKPFSHVVLSAKIKSMKRIRSLHSEIAMLYSQMRNDQETAEAVFNGAVIAENLDLEGVETLLKPAELFSGDVLLSAHAPSRDVHIMLGDFTGHGLAAALGALPASEVFRAMTAKGFSSHQVLSGINKKLHALLPTGMFFATQFIVIGSELDYASVCNCGMPDILLIDGNSGKIKQRFKSNSLPLGITPDIEFVDLFEHTVIERGDRFLLLSDGVSEARDPEDNYFGQQRLEEAINSRPDGMSAIESIRCALEIFCKEAKQDDDISLAEIPCIPSILPVWSTHTSKLDVTFDNPEDEASFAKDSLKFSLTLNGKRLREADPIPMILNHVQEMEGLQNHRRVLFTLLTEMYVNALDHGVLNLDSALKHSPDGFSKYFTEREERLSKLNDGQITIAIHSHITKLGGRIIINVEDSGLGFDFSSYLNQDTPEETMVSGRGVFLLYELCESVTFFEPGNKVEVVYSWTNDN